MNLIKNLLFKVYVLNLDLKQQRIQAPKSDSNNYGLSMFYKLLSPYQEHWTYKDTVKTIQTSAISGTIIFHNGTYI